MCGRYYRRADKQRIAEAFRLGQLPADFVLPPDFNVAPTTMQPVIRQSRDTGARELVMMRWGLVPNELTAEVHNRMPVILHDRDYDRWLDRGERERPPVDLLRPYEADAMLATACNPTVGNPRNNGPEMLNSA